MKDNEGVCPENGHAFVSSSESPAAERGGTAKSRFTAALAGVGVAALVCGLLIALLTFAYKRISSAEPPIPEPESISIRPEEPEKPICPGAELRLIPEFLPEGSAPSELIWRSDNESVAFVDETGLVRVVGEGEAVITAVSGRGVVGSYIVVSQKRPVSARFSEDEIALKIGESYSPELIVEPDGAPYSIPEWKSSEPGVVEIDGSGVIKAVGKGKTWLTAAVNGELTASMGVFVYEYESDVLADMIVTRGELDKASDCWYYVLDKSDIAEEGLRFTKYVELVYYPDDGYITVCCDIYDEGLSFYYETVAGFSRGEAETAEIVFRCSLEGGMSSSHTVPLSTEAAIMDAFGSIRLSEYRRGDPVSLRLNEGDPAFRETAENIASSMLNYSFGVLSQKWNALGMPFDIERTLGLKGL